MKIARLLAIPLTVAGIATAAAHGGGNMPKPFMQRHAVMGSIAAHMTAIKSAIVKGDAKTVARHAEAIHWLARIIPDAFPKGSGAEMGKTRASAKIWSDWDGFTKAAAELADEAKILTSQAKAGDKGALLAQFATLGKRGCVACHKAYRTPKR